MRLLPLTLLLTACASAPRPTGPGADAPPPEPTADPTTVAPPKGLDTLPLPWLIVERAASLGELPAGLKLPTTPPTSLGEYALINLVKALPKESLPPSLQAQLGKKLTVYGPDGEARCEVVVGGFEARRQLEGESWETSQIMYPDEPEPAEEGAEAPPPPEPEPVRFQRAFEAGPLALVATLMRTDGTPYAGCKDEDFDFMVAAAPAPHLRPTETVDKALATAGVKAFRAHPFWEQQQHDYQRSIELDRTKSRTEYQAALAEAKKNGASRQEIAEIYKETRADDAPRTWDRPRRGEPDDGPNATLWSDADGKARFLVVILGNDVSCAAPDGWMVFAVDGAELTTEAFGVGTSPEGFLDVDGDGRWEATFDSWFEKRIERLDPALDDPALRRLELPGGGFHCAWEQIPPLTGEP